MTADGMPPAGIDVSPLASLADAAGPCAGGGPVDVPADTPADRAVDGPVPPDSGHDIGDGDFRAIGAEFLEHFVTLGELTPDDDVLDVGCGFGRMALPLTGFLAPRARYLGFDVVREPIEWCRAHVAPLHPGFGFEHVDARHPLYNPDGALPADCGFLRRVPAPLGWRPSFVAAVSVLTHLEPAPLLRLLADARAVLRPAGRLFLTAFLTGPGTPPLGDGTRFPAAEWRQDGPLVALRGDPATAAVGVPWAWLAETLAGLGLQPERVRFGHWRGDPDPAVPFQDVVVAW